MKWKKLDRYSNEYLAGKKARLLGFKITHLYNPKSFSDRQFWAGFFGW